MRISVEIRLNTSKHLGPGRIQHGAKTLALLRRYWMKEEGEQSLCKMLLNSLICMRRLTSQN